MNFSNDQQKAVDSIIEGKNIFLTGKAGTGKSFVIKECIKILQRAKKNVAILGTTGIAANNIGGQTLHSFFKVPINGVATFEKCFYTKIETREIWDMTKVIIIDEVSMLRPDTLDSINWTLVKNKCRSLRSKQIIFIGDLKQLPPVVIDNEIMELEQKYGGLSFLDSEICEKLHLEAIELTTIHRQSDPEFIENLNILRDGGKSEYFKQFVTDQTNGIILCPHKATAGVYNTSELNKIDSETFTSEAVIQGNNIKVEDFNIEKTLHLKDGCRVMFLLNLGRLVNGSIGTLEIKDNKLYFNDSEGRVLICKEEFEKKEYYLKDNGKLDLRKVGSIMQYPLKLAYALTIHKSQGLTFENVTIDLRKKCFEKGQLYTAISRVKSPKGLNLIL